MGGFEYLGYRKKDLPISETLSKNIVSLPMHPYLEFKDIDFILSNIKNK